MNTIILQYSTDNTNWVDLKTPSSYSVSFSDLDNDSYRAVATGNLIRRVVNRRWAKLGISYNYLTTDECNTICSAVNRDTLYIRCKSPAFGNLTVKGETNQWISFKAYVSELSMDTIRSKNEYGFKLSFNIIQSSVSSFQ